MVETLLEVRQLSKTFRYRTGWFHRQTVEAVKPLSFTLRERQTLAIIGENGSGKSTLAKMLAGMVEPTSGELLIDDHPLTFGDYSYRSQKIRMIFQDPSTSLNPRQRISQILDFPLRLNTDLDAEARQQQSIDTLRMVGLLPDHVSYYPHMLAPGQKQRLGLARALILRPKVIVCDEALASLDMSMRSQLINLMLELQEKMGLTYLFISHNLSVVKHVSNKIAVMYLGKIMEVASYRDIFLEPHHPYTKALLSAIPIPKAHLNRERIILEGDITSPVNPPAGCRFASRCWKCKEICKQQSPELRKVGNSVVACHFAEED